MTRTSPPIRCRRCRCRQSCHRGYNISTGRLCFRLSVSTTNTETKDNTEEGCPHLQVLHLGVISACIVRIGSFSSHTGQYVSAQHNTFSAGWNNLEPCLVKAPLRKITTHLSAFLNSVNVAVYTTFGHARESRQTRYSGMILWRSLLNRAPSQMGHT
jgi:hypothetical protein